MPQIRKWAGLHVDPVAAAEAARKEAYELGGLMTDERYGIPKLSDFLEEVQELRSVTEPRCGR